MMDRVRVLIVDDSPFIRKALLRIFESEPSIEVAGIARDGKEAIEKTIALKPDVITLDIMMPGMDGIETLKILMETQPTPVLMLSQYTHEGADLTLNALEFGAMDFIDKSTTGMMDFFELAKEISSKIKAIAGSKPRPLLISPLVGRDKDGLKDKEGFRSRGLIDVVAIGASTGGPPALQVLLTKLPKDITFGILIVQHMPQGFTGPLANRLNTMCKIRVKEAEDGDKIAQGLALIAPSGLHMKVTPPFNSPLNKGGHRGVKLSIEPLNTIHRPSADVLFQSVAENYGSRSMGVILTGMGSDGASGMKLIKEQGGITFAQDEETSTIFGMPRVAIENGGVDKVLPLFSMAEEILKIV
ncbi:MAG: chemotaxis response regulator protein-glutamate methylesterase [Nitrospirae bacterium]|nr:chemotaxis response regulator protein-glutamate methylesterase [Nitrospirota bacterium]